MKKIYLLALTLFSLTVMQSQSLDCAKAHIGTFEIDEGQYGILRIERTEHTQTESCLLMNFKATYDIAWIDECNYELRNKKIIRGESPSGAGNAPTDILKVKILKTVGSTITLRLSSNYTDFVTECDITKVK